MRKILIGLLFVFVTVFAAQATSVPNWQIAFDIGDPSIGGTGRIIDNSGKLPEISVTFAGIVDKNQSIKDWIRSLDGTFEPIGYIGYVDYDFGSSKIQTSVGWSDYFDTGAMSSGIGFDQSTLEITQVSAVPEPGIFFLFSLGLLGLLISKKKLPQQLATFKSA